MEKDLSFLNELLSLLRESRESLFELTASHYGAEELRDKLDRPNDLDCYCSQKHKESQGSIKFIHSTECRSVYNLMKKINYKLEELNYR